MFIANQLKTKNRAEYLLYLWQVEDVMRAYNCDADRISSEYLSRFNASEAQLNEAREWYANLCEMMRSEGVKEKGHLQICKNILQELSELNAQLLASQKFPYFREMYFKVLPYIVELRRKQQASAEATQTGSSAAAQPEAVAQTPELETCFNLLYGVMLLRLKKQTVSPETEKAVADVAQMLGTLSDYYFKNKENPIEFE